MVLTGDDDDAALTALVLGKPAIAAIFFVIGRLYIAADVGAIGLDDTL